MRPAIALPWVGGLLALAICAIEPACSEQCSPQMTSIDLGLTPAQSGSFTVDVVVDGQTLTAVCPAQSGSLDNGVGYFCGPDLLVLQIPNLDLAGTNKVTVTVTTSAGQVLTKDMSVSLGAVEKDNSDETPGHCARAGGVTLM